jgi:hypothetical protein
MLKGSNAHVVVLPYFAPKASAPALNAITQPPCARESFYRKERLREVNDKRL